MTVKTNGGLVLLAALMMGLLGAGCGELGELDLQDAEVRQFNSCDQVETHVKFEAAHTMHIEEKAAAEGASYDPYGYTDTPTVETFDSVRAHSTTNDQERGVAEADIFQVDETHAFALHEGRLIVVEMVENWEGPGILQVEDARVVADVPLDGEPLEMFLDGDIVAVVMTVDRQELPRLYEAAASSLPNRDEGSIVQVSVFNVSDRHNPEKVRDVAVEGDYLASRRVDDELYLVARAGLGGPRLQAPSYGKDNFDDWAEAQQARIQSAHLDEWLPYSLSRSYTGTIATERAARVDCGSVYTAQSATGDDALGIYSFALHKPQSRVKSTTFIGDGTMVYGSTESIVVAHTNYARTTYDDGDTERIEATALHRFALKADGGTQHTASGLVHGWVLNPFSISEHEGYVRVTTQMDRLDDFAMYKPINVFTMPTTPRTLKDILQLEPEQMEGVSEAEAFMNVTGVLEDIAPGEDLYATRWMGDIGYVVTFLEEKGDPLYTVDVSDQDNPKIRGALNIPGFSSYLHPIENGRLVGVGRTASDQIKLSIFDVSNMNQPTAVEEIGIGGMGALSEALANHRAFRYLPERKLMAMPLQAVGNEHTLELYRVESDGFRHEGSLEHAGAPMRRAYESGGNLYVLSNLGVKVIDLDDYSQLAVVEFD